MRCMNSFSFCSAAAQAEHRTHLIVTQTNLQFRGNRAIARDFPVCSKRGTDVTFICGELTGAKVSLKKGHVCSFLTQYDDC